MVKGILVSSLLSVALGCATAPPKPLTRNVTLEAMRIASAWPDADDGLILTTAQQFLAARRFHEGYDFFHARAAEAPQRPLFLALEGMFKALMAGEVPLLSRVKWVDGAITKLDRAAASDPVWGRYIRGLAFAELPDRFHKEQQAIDDLTSVLEHPPVMIFDPERGIYRALARAYETQGRHDESARWLARAGLKSLSPDEPRILGDISVTAREGFRFGQPRLVQFADGIYSAEGFDFGGMAFIETSSGIVAIDAGSEPKTAAAALAEMRKRSSAPIQMIILTHSHWDHVGGVDALRAPGVPVVAHERFAETMRRVAAKSPPNEWFLGSSRSMPSAVKIDRRIGEPTEITVGGRTLLLVPLPPSETADPLMIVDTKTGVAFVGDAFQPYIGAPTSPEGSPAGLLQVIRVVLAQHPKKLLHGHTPLTRVFTVDAMPGLEAALTTLYATALRNINSGVAVADSIAQNLVAESLRTEPKAVLPYLLMRDNFIKRMYDIETGYWQRDGAGVEAISDRDWAAALDLLAGSSEDAFVRTGERLLDGGDYALALRMAELGLERHAKSERLSSIRERALSRLRERYSSIDPFRFIWYSEKQKVETPSDAR
jgi:glyoxylase-like metal-dependent hydrolase (beta-lactamase superfamily II)